MQPRFFLFVFIPCVQDDCGHAYVEHGAIVQGSPFTRNLVNRIEVLTPVYDEQLQHDLERTIDYGLHDTTKSTFSPCRRL